jgi:hypothetical protein
VQNGLHVQLLRHYELKAHEKIKIALAYWYVFGIQIGRRQADGYGIRI